MKRLAHYSQHFLRSPRLIKELVGHAKIKRGDLVYDIGAGSGVISSVLAECASHIVAIEAEPRTAEKLRANMAKYPNVTVIEDDFLKMNLPAQPYKIFANIPFHLSSPIVRKLVETPNPPSAIYLIVQKQFGNKLLIDTDAFTGQLGAFIAPWFEVRMKKQLRKTDFWPHPNVDTVFVELLRRTEPLIPTSKMPQFQQFTADCFSTPKIFEKMSKADASIPPDTKPSQLTRNQWVELFEKQHIY